MSTTWICEYDGTEVPRDELCPSCVLYNAAVAAQRAAAAAIASDIHERAERAWLNEHGVFAFVDGKTALVASAEAAAPFVALTAAARRVKFADGRIGAEELPTQPPAAKKRKGRG